MVLVSCLGMGPLRLATAVLHGLLASPADLVRWLAAIAAHLATCGVAVLAVERVWLRSLRLLAGLAAAPARVRDLAAATARFGIASLFGFVSVRHGCPLGLAFQLLHQPPPDGHLAHAVV